MVGWVLYGVVLGVVALGMFVWFFAMLYWQLDAVLWDGCQEIIFCFDLFVVNAVLRVGLVYCLFWYY